MKIHKKEKQDKNSYIVTKETMGMTILLFSAIFFIMLVTGEHVFADIGKAVCAFAYGTFGYCSYLLIALLAYLGEWLVFEKKIKITLIRSLAIGITVFFLSLLFHSVTTRGYVLEGYGKYISDCYVNAQNGFSGYTFGGVISAIFVYPIAKFAGFITAYIVYSIFSLASLYLIFLTFKKDFSFPALVKRPRKNTEQVSEQKSEPVAQPAVQPINQQRPTVEPKTREPETKKDYGRKILFKNDEFAAESYRRNMIFNESSYFNSANSVISGKDYLSSFSSGKKTDVPKDDYSESYQSEKLAEQPQQAPVNYVYGEKPLENLNSFNDETEEFSEPESNIYKIENPAAVQKPPEDDYSESIREGRYNNYRDVPEESEPDYEEKLNIFEEPVQNTSPVSSENNYEDKLRIFDEPVQNSRLNRTEQENQTDDNLGVRGLVGRDFDGVGSLRGERSRADIFDDDAPEAPISRSQSSEPDLGSRAIRRQEEMDEVKPAKREEPAALKEEKQEMPKHVWKKYVRPGLDLLDDYNENNNINTSEIEDNKLIIVTTLQRYKIDCDIANVVIGPAVTRYDVVIKDNTNFKKALGFRDVIAMELRKENVTAYPNYGKGAISIEIPNNERAVVGLKGILANSKFINAKNNTLTFALGKNVEGEVVCPDVTKMPHLLVAGTTGSGKSICLSALLVSLLYKYGPEDLRLILVDPKQVEFISFDKLPHLMINEILSEVNQAVKALNWAVKEMERRYTLFREMTESGIATKNLDEYNAHITDPADKLPKIVIVLDEFGDLMLYNKKDIESRIIKLAQKARACGIHLILATQRPSVDCITGLIKSNLPTRIGFKVNSFDDSRTIFDIGGAEKLLGKGDMYFRSTENPDLLRIQGCFINSDEVQRVCDYVKAHNETYFDQSVADFINKEEEEAPAPVGGAPEDEVQETKIDDTFLLALRYCVNSNQASVSMIQRRFPVGYIKACKIIDWMTNMNYITPSEGSKSRKVLLTKEEFIKIYGDDFDD